MSCNCNEFSRAQVLRQAVAQAGRGLPSIEPGMPLPAGTGMSRRSLLVRSAGLALSVYGADKISGLQMVEGIEAAAAASPSHPVIISAFVPGGWDALSVLSPVRDSLYRQWRPTLAAAENPALNVQDNPDLQWHASAGGLKTLHDEGKVTLFPGIGYTGANQSHFTSRHYWEVGETNPMGRTGWLGRYLDQHGSNDNPLQGLSLAGVLLPTLATAANPVAAVSRPETYTFTAQGVRSDMNAEMFAAFKRMGQGAAGEDALSYARNAISYTAGLREQLAPFTTVTSPVAYPNTSTFARQMSALAAMIAGGLPLRAVSVNVPGGYDTHEGQAASLSNGLQQTGDVLLAFQRDLEARQIADRVLVLLWSEFGRRPKENGSLGTDHGAGGAAFLIGSRASGLTVGEFPGLKTLDREGNLRNTSDFRAVYCSLLEQWLGVDAEPVIPNAKAFARPVLIR